MDTGEIISKNPHIEIICGDCLEVLKTFPENSVDSVVTDPPYNLISINKRFGKEGSTPAKYGKDGSFQRLSKGFMGKEWDGTGISFRMELWSEIFRVLKPGGHLISFGGTRTYHRMAVAIEDAGFEVRDMLEWMYASGFPKSLNVGKAVKAKELTGGSSPKNLRQSRMGDNYEPTGQEDYRKGRMFSAEIENDNTKEEINNEWEGFGTALKPAHEPIIVARKPLSEKTIVENVLKHGTGAIDIDGCRIPIEKGDEPHGGYGDEVIGFGPFDNKGGVKWKQSPTAHLGRFPANILCTDDALNDNQTGDTYTDFGSKSRYFDIDVWAEKYGILQFPKASKRERGKGNSHPTVKSLALMSWLVRLVTPPDGVCLDPFMGSGTTGIACKELGFGFIGIEKEKEYFKIAEARISYEKSLQQRFW